MVAVRRARTPRTALPSGLVARAPDGQDQPRRCRIALDLRAETLNRNVNQARVTEVVVAPDEVEEQVARQHLARPASELEQQVEFGPGDRHLLAVPLHGPPGD